LLSLIFPSTSKFYYRAGELSHRAREKESADGIIHIIEALLDTGHSTMRGSCGSKAEIVTRGSQFRHFPFGSSRIPRLSNTEFLLLFLLIRPIRNISGCHLLLDRNRVTGERSPAFLSDSLNPSLPASEEPARRTWRHDRHLLLLTHCQYYLLNPEPQREHCMCEARARACDMCVRAFMCATSRRGHSVLRHWHRGHYYVPTDAGTICHAIRAGCINLKPLRANEVCVS